MTAPIISVENLSKRYVLGAPGRRGQEGLRHTLERMLRNPLAAFQARQRDEFWALHDVTFDVRQGEVLGIIGRNGAGKSTLLKILSRITEPTTGRVRLRGRVASLLEVGTGFHPELTGRENVYLNGAILGMRRSEIRRKFDAIVEFADVEQFLDTPVKRYSSGMYVRLAFSVAAHLEPDILIVDEVLAVGDAAFQRKCLGKLEDAASQEGRTVLLVTHNMAMIENLCGRVALLQGGSLAAVGEPGQIVGRYISSLSGASTVRLADRVDRQGTGDLKITALELLDRSGQHIDYPMSGQDLVIRLYFQGAHGVVFKNSRVALTITKEERPYFMLSTDMVDSRPLNLTGEGWLDFVLPDLPLTGGSYQLASFVASSGSCQDWVEGAAEMTVIDGDFYGTGRSYPPGWQGRCVLVRFGWSLGVGDEMARQALPSC